MGLIGIVDVGAAVGRWWLTCPTRAVYVIPMSIGSADNTQKLPLPSISETIPLVPISNSR